MKILVLLFMIGMTQAIAAPGGQLQEKEIAGTVTDENGNPMPGVNIVVKGTTTGIITDLNGKYSIKVITTDAVLVFSFVGYQEESIEVNDQVEINISLQPVATELEEVIAWGYGTQKKAVVVGSVSWVKGDKLAEMPTSDVTNAISGVLPGVSTMLHSGEPGDNAAEIRVRGRTTLHGTGPLVVIDGVPGRSLSEVDMEDIEDITVLKDASAAIYGATAANGVILVTTKSGKSLKTHMEVNSYVGFMTPTIIPDMLNAGEYSTMLSEYQIYENKERRYSDNDIELFKSGRDPWEHPNTDWFDALVADWTTRQKHNIVLDGTTKGIGYYFSLGYRDEKAIYEQESTRYSQYNARAKLNVPITDWLSVSYDFAGFQTQRSYPTKSEWQIFGESTRLLPTHHAFWPTGEPGPDIEHGDNPVVTSSFQTGHDDQTHYKTQNTFQINLIPIENLSINARYSHDVDNGYYWYFQKPWILYFGDWDNAVRNSDGFITSMPLIPRPRGTDSPHQTEQYHRDVRKLANLSANYVRNFGEHYINLFGAVEQYTNDGNYITGFRKYYISDRVQTLNAGGEKEKDNSGERWIYSRRSYIGRVSYNYMEKYLAEFVIRRDGSLKYSPETRWGNFPSIMIGWRASEESFWQESLAFVNYFKLRASYGKLGMDPGAPFQYLNKYGISTGLPFGSDKTIENTVYQQGVANPNITWEKETAYNIGFESQFLDNTFYLETDIFYKIRSDILAYRNASVPEFVGLTLPQENIAEVDNRGFEIIAGYNKTLGQDFRLSLSGNITYSKNEVVYMDEPAQSVAWQERTGRPYGVTLMYESIGVYANQGEIDASPHWSDAKPGDIIFKDVSGDGILDADDKILLDKTETPRTFYGISLDLSYKKWTLSILVQGQGEHYQLLNGPNNERGEAGNYFKWSYDGRWTEGDLSGVEMNTNTDVPRAWNREDQYWNWFNNDNTYWWANMAYCRLKNVVLSYNIPFREGIGISSADIYLSGNNLALIYSAQRNFDPEVANPYRYPPTKTIAVGVRLTF